MSATETKSWRVGTEVSESGWLHVIDEDDNAVCAVFAGEGQRENAAMIAAAPELLEALQAILFQVCQGKVLERDSCIAQARAAFCKSTGHPSPRPASATW